VFLKITLIQGIFQLLLKRLMPASSGIADGRLKEMYSQQRREIRRYFDRLCVPLPISQLRCDPGEDMESEWWKMEVCSYFDDRSTGDSCSIHFLEENK